MRGVRRLVSHRDPNAYPSPADALQHLLRHRYDDPNDVFYAFYKSRGTKRKEWFAAMEDLPSGALMTLHRRSDSNVSQPGAEFTHAIEDVLDARKRRGEW